MSDEHANAVAAVVEAAGRAAQQHLAETPIRQRSAKGEPKPKTSIERTCRRCGASFIGLAPGKTGERGLWAEMGWWCSVECYPGRVPQPKWAADRSKDVDAAEAALAPAEAGER